MNGWVTDWVAEQWLGLFDDAWWALHVQDPGRAGAVESEVVGGSYKRQESGFTSVESRTIWLPEKVTWVGLPAVIISHIGVWNSAVNGRLLSAALLPVPHPQVAQGASFVLNKHTYAISIGLPA